MAVEYRDIPWAKGYRVGDDGSVWSCRIAPAGFSADWHQLKPIKQSTGYTHVRLGRNDQTAVHRLVLEVFVGPCPSQGMVAAHGNGVRHDNRLENLRWATRSENEADKELHGTKRIGGKLSWTKLGVEEVVEIRRLASDGESDLQLSRRYKISRAAVHSIRTRKSWRHVA